MAVKFVWNGVDVMDEREVLFDELLDELAEQRHLTATMSRMAFFSFAPLGVVPSSIGQAGE